MTSSGGWPWETHQHPQRPFLLHFIALWIWWGASIQLHLPGQSHITCCYLSPALPDWTAAASTLFLRFIIPCDVLIMPLHSTRLTRRIYGRRCSRYHWSWRTPDGDVSARQSLFIRSHCLSFLFYNLIIMNAALGSIPHSWFLYISWSKYSYNIYFI